MKLLHELGYVKEGNQIVPVFLTKEKSKEKIAAQLIDPPNKKKISQPSSSSTISSQNFPSMMQSHFLNLQE